MKNFAGIDDAYAGEKESLVVLLPVEYDGTSSWIKGSDGGPEALFNAAKNMELYDLETDSEPFEVGIHVAKTLKNFNTSDQMCRAVYECTRSYILQDKLVGIIGGEHSVSIGSIRAHTENYKDLTVVHLDAHADLRAEYAGSSFSHACAMHEASLTTNLIQLGIRSMDKSEKQFMNFAKTYFAHEMMSTDGWMREAIDQMTDNVYISIDLDVLDPSELPSTGTPEPGGLSYYQLTSFLRMICEEHEVVGFDIVELCPNEADKSSDFMAAKLLYKLIAYKYFT
jgi:agmatinase